MKIFITGSSGYIASELVTRLKKNHDVVTYDISNEQDILNYEQLAEEMAGCDIVIHCAAIRGPYENRPFQDYFDINVVGVTNVARACVENKIKKLIFSSSTSFYGAEDGFPFLKPLKESNPTLTQFLTYSETENLEGKVAYSTSKVMAEQVLANYGILKLLRVIILRIGPVGGKRGERWWLDGISVKIDNVIQAFEKALLTDDNLWYESFTITDDVPNVDLTKAKTILKYQPN